LTVCPSSTDFGWQRRKEILGATEGGLLMVIVWVRVEQALALQA
jgi:hypothetical protein